MTGDANDSGGDAGAASAAADFAKACEALAPAFALALAKAAEAPERWAALSRTLLASAGRTPPAQAEEFLDAVFGGSAFRQAVAQQAAAMSGVAASAVAGAMPRLAMLGAEAMLRTATGGNPAALGTPLPTDAFGPFAAEMMRRGANAVEAFSRPSGAAGPKSSGPAGAWFANPFLGAFASALRDNGAAARGSAAAAAGSASAATLPFAALFDAFAAGMRQPPAGTATPPPAASPTDLLDVLARSGQRFREDYAKGMAALFERFPTNG